MREMMIKTAGLGLLLLLLLQGCGSSESRPDTTVEVSTASVSNEGMSSDAGAEISLSRQIALEVTLGEESVKLRWDPGSEADYYEVTKVDDSYVSELLVSDNDERTVTDYDVKEGILYRYTLTTFSSNGEILETLESGVRILHYEQLMSDEIDE